MRAACVGGECEVGAELAAGECGSMARRAPLRRNACERKRPGELHLR